MLQLSKTIFSSDNHFFIVNAAKIIKKSKNLADNTVFLADCHMNLKKYMLYYTL